MVELIAKGHKFNMGLYSEILLELMATNFSPSKGSYVLNQFPMFCMKGFDISASGAIQSHHGPFVVLRLVLQTCIKQGLFGKGLIFSRAFHLGSH